MELTADAFGRPFAREKLRQAENSRFCRRVSRHARQRDMRSDGGDVDDAAPPRPNHGSSILSAWVVNAAAVVERHDGVPFVRIHLFKRVLLCDGRFGSVAAGGVDKYGRLSEQSGRFFVRLPDAFRVYCVAEDKGGFSACAFYFADALHPSFFAPPKDRRRGARFRQPDSDPPAQDARCGR